MMKLCWSTLNIHLGSDIRWPGCSRHPELSFPCHINIFYADFNYQVSLTSENHNAGPASNQWRKKCYIESIWCWTICFFFALCWYACHLQHISLLKRHNQAKIIKKSVILFRLLNMTIWCKRVHRLELQKFLNFCAVHLPVKRDIKTKLPYFLFWTCIHVRNKKSGIPSLYPA